MKKSIKYLSIIIAVIFLYRLFFCNFLIQIKFLDSTYENPMPWNFPGGILSPVAEYKVKGKVYNYIIKNQKDIKKKMFPDKFDIDKFSILSIVNEGDTKQVLVNLGDGTTQNLLFVVKGDDVKMDGLDIYK